MTSSTTAPVQGDLFDILRDFGAWCETHAFDLDKWQGEARARGLTLNKDGNLTQGKGKPR